MQHKMKQYNDVSHILVSEEEIDAITTDIAARISRDFENEEHILLVGILKGSMPFMADLMRKLDVPAEIDFMKVSSYGSGTVSTRETKIILDLKRNNIEDCAIIIIEDIIDSGFTLKNVVAHLNELGAKSVHTCTMLDKPSRREVEFTPDYVGREIPNEFVIGYGLDYDERYRTLPFIGVLDPKVYSN